MNFFFEILVRIASYGPQIDQSHGENRLSHIIKLLNVVVMDCFSRRPNYRKLPLISLLPSYRLIYLKTKIRPIKSLLDASLPPSPNQIQ